MSVNTDVLSPSSPIDAADGCETCLNRLQGIGYSTTTAERLKNDGF